jgi:hypothetical protein
MCSQAVFCRYHAQCNTVLFLDLFAVVQTEQSEQLMLSEMKVVANFSVLSVFCCKNRPAKSYVFHRNESV